MALISSVGRRDAAARLHREGKARVARSPCAQAGGRRRGAGPAARGCHLRPRPAPRARTRSGRRAVPLRTRVRDRKSTRLNSSHTDIARMPPSRSKNKKTYKQTFLYESESPNVQQSTTVYGT